ncbi:tail sheath [Serratia phage BF]|uniref:Tail sheath protein n=1 Tax=Serratia phage BF TaxID=1962671 RepID=A0A1S6UAF8_9CAUD|nr:tail sheath [Serratia phage BF]AQW88725.1 tail sheath protein [Serratia phage BF]
MADLLSPGVSVTVTDETISSTSGAGTVPLFVIATAQDKLVTGSTSVAAGTTKANAGKLQLITSQRNALEMYGSPIFQKSNGSVVQGDELNEYGLHAVYSYMGIANRAYVVRADVDMAQLAPTGTEPTGPVTNGTLWLDTSATQIEAYVARIANPTSFYDWQLKPVTIVSYEDIDDVPTNTLNVDDLVLRHIPSTGQMLMYKFEAIGLVQVETYLSPINKVPTGTGILKGNIWIRDGYTKNGSNYFGTRFVLKRYASLTAVWNEVNVWTGNSFYEIESKAGTFDNTYFGSLFDEDSKSFSLYTKSGSIAAISAPATPIGQSSSQVATSIGYLTIKYLNKSVQVPAILQSQAITTANLIANLNQSAVLINAGFTFTGTNALVVTNKNGYSFQVSASGQQIFNTAELAKLTVDSNNYSLINVNNLRVSATTPTAKAANGTYWYDFSNSDSLKVTMYVANVSTEDWDLIVESDQYVQLDEPAADRDFWVKPLSQGVEGYEFYRNVSGSWVKLDSTDQSTLNGMVFEDFTSGNVPSAALYQNGMLAIDLGNTEGVVKVMTNGIWTIASGVALDGAGLFGRAAQRQIIVEALAAVVIGNEEIRAESIDYNLVCVPGYVELLDELVTLNTDRKETAFIVTDVPARLAPSSTDVQAWATNANNAASNGDVGRTTGYAYAAQYMGWCLSTNVDGSEIAVPGSTVAMRTYAYSDSVSYVWYPPAGTQRGVVTNAASVGFINSEGEYAPVVYNQGQRDTMYVNKINPIAMRPNRGLLVYGDKTLAPDDGSALSRVNVARLVVYIRRQLEIMAEPFLFRLNTPSTRQEFTSVVNNFLAEIVQLNGLYDFLVVCDESNNTTTRIDRNELWMDIALVPTRSINFIYIPIRLENSLTQ